MTTYQHNPLEIFGYYDWIHYNYFKKYLRMPVPYLRVIFKNYRDLTIVPALLPKLLYTINEHWWKMNSTPSRHEIQSKVAGVPALYLQQETTPICKGDVLKYYQLALEKIIKFSTSGKVLYLHSEYETNSLHAASQLVKQAIKNGIPCCMVDLPTVMAEIKTWQETELLKKLKKAQVACIYMIGKEFSTEFTQSNLETLIQQRTVENKVTLLCSHLAPPEFRTRYGIEVPGTVLKFEDEKITKTLATLLKELEN